MQFDSYVYSCAAARTFAGESTGSVFFLLSVFKVSESADMSSHGENKINSFIFPLNFSLIVNTSETAISAPEPSAPMIILSVYVYSFFITVFKVSKAAG